LVVAKVDSMVNQVLQAALAVAVVLQMLSAAQHYNQVVQQVVLVLLVAQAATS
jgi:hypothetical protein